MNAYHRLVREAKAAAFHDADLRRDGKGESFPIRKRDGDTLYVTCTIGPRGGATYGRRVVAGWVKDHPADMAEASY